MSQQEKNSAEEEGPAKPAGDEGGSDRAATATADSATPTESTGRIPEFEELNERIVPKLDQRPDRLHDVCVPVWAELGRAEMLIGELLQLGEGSVIRLDRSVGDPVDLISQGVKLARGEVIVVDDHFAIRVCNIVSANG